MSEQNMNAVPTNIGDESVAARFKTMSGATSLRVDAVGRRTIRIEAQNHAEELSALGLTETVCKILACEYRWERTNTFITVTILEPS